jgi:hypothetical protein
MAHNLEPSRGSVFAQVIVLPVGTALSGVLTWFLFGNLYGALAFVVLFVIGAVTEALRQRRARSRQDNAGVAMGDYISRLHDAARESGMDLKPPPREGV